MGRALSQTRRNVWVPSNHFFHQNQRNNGKNVFVVRQKLAYSKDTSSKTVIMDKTQFPQLRLYDMQFFTITKSTLSRYSDQTVFVEVDRVGPKATGLLEILL